MKKLLERCTGRYPPHINIMKIQNIINKSWPIYTILGNLSMYKINTIYGMMYCVYIPTYKTIFSSSEKGLIDELKKRKLI